MSFAMYGWASYDMLGWCVAFERSAPMDLPARTGASKESVSVFGCQLWMCYANTDVTEIRTAMFSSQ